LYAAIDERQVAGEAIEQAAQVPDAASIFSRGSNELRTPRTDAVDWHQLHEPLGAPLRDTARGLNPDSARITAVTSRSGMPYRLDASVISRAYGSGSPCGSRNQPAWVPVREPIR